MRKKSMQGVIKTETKKKQRKKNYTHTHSPRALLF
mgnify:FL=1